MTTPIQRVIWNTIQRHGMLRPGNKLGLAVSGGADSVALLRLFAEMRGELGVTLCVLHFNHHLRGAESDADENFVKLLASANGLECIAESADAGAVAKRRGWNLEDAARRLRYEFFENAVARGAATRVATAHTADDQAETVLARVIRGTGLAGLSSIYPVRGKIIRPLIAVRREKLRAFLAERNQEWREDATNRDTQRLRARVRHRLLPELESNFSQSIVERLCDLAGLARDDEEFWSALVDERYRELVSQTPKGLCVNVNDLLLPIAIPRIKKAPGDRAFRALTQRLIRRLCADAANGKGQLSRSHVEEVIHLAGQGSSGRHIELPGGVTVEREFGKLIFRARDDLRGTKHEGKMSATVQSYEYEVRLPEGGSTAISIPELGRCFQLKMIDWPKTERDTRWEGAVLDADHLCAPLVLRNWQPGDAYRPFGHRQERKLARLLSAGRVGITERAQWPVLTSAGRVAWADRMPVAADFSATEGTRTGLWIVEDVR